MKKRLFSLLLSVLTLPFLGTGQNTLVLQPDASCGKDAILSYLHPNNNYGSHDDFNSLAWTNGGRPSTHRSLIDFDISQIPQTCQIINATLTLYGYNSPHNGAHWSLSGPNTSILQRVTSPWDENSVTWNTQPSTTTVNQLILTQSSFPGENYVLDVTALVEDIVADPNNSYGFMIRLQTEQYYRKLVFASSDNSDPSLHPKLEITYASCNLELLNTVTCHLDSDGDGFGDPANS